MSDLPLAVVGWVAVFEGGRYFIDADAGVPSPPPPTRISFTGSRWSDLPADGLLAVKLYFADRAHGHYLARVMQGSDYYFRAGEVYGHSDDPPAEITARYPGARIIRGKWVSDQEMREALRVLTEWRW